MYLLTVLAIILSTIFMIQISGQGMGMLSNFIDIPSLLALLIVTIPILISANLLKDFNNALKIVFGKENQQNSVMIKKAIEAVELTRKIVLCASAFIVLVQSIIILRQLDDPAALGPNIAIAVLSLLYGITVNLLLLPVASKLKVKVIEFMQE